jgi:RNA polymerase sigma factor (sigma-70 family)
MARRNAAAQVDDAAHVGPDEGRLGAEVVALLRRRRLDQRVGALRREESTDLHADELGDALATLTPQRRTAVILEYCAGLREREIAEAMGIPAGTVKSLLHRSLAQLREVIER